MDKLNVLLTIFILTQIFYLNYKIACLETKIEYILQELRGFKNGK